ncbi:4365_t:CDS:2 [Cetraspora pellucida]|uniref:4365_t:CDS:1 n=1 Tax=Cetraspora pellucida TaxID=1433469 RepID=A0ACA9K7P0_9GLOM|nr:4365_t:CDS:2 [Cetraspora pellucida]
MNSITANEESNCITINGLLRDTLRNSLKLIDSEMDVIIYAYLPRFCVKVNVLIG